MNRVLLFLFFAVISLELVGLSFLVPAHLRAVDAKLIDQSLATSRSIVDSGIALVNREKIGPAELLLQAAEKQLLPGYERLREHLDQFSEAHPELIPFGGADPYLERIFPASPIRGTEKKSIVELFIPREARARLLEALQHSRRPAVRDLLAHRDLTNTVRFPPVHSASGQALETAILMTALLFQGDYLAPALRDSITAMAAEATNGGDIQKLESFYLDILSLGRRFNWVQLTEFIRSTGSLDLLHDLAHLVRKAGNDLPLLFSAVCLSQSPQEVANYLKTFSKTGLGDLGYSLRGGEGGLRELLLRQHPVYYPTYRNLAVSYVPLNSIFEAFARLSRDAPPTGLLLKWVLIFLAGFVLAWGAHFWRHELTWQERKIQIPGFRTVREGLFGLVFLLVCIPFVEPFLAQESQRIEFPVRLSFPRSAGALLAQVTNSSQTTMIDQWSIVALVMFLALQGIIYLLCLVKLAEIRRQPVPSKMKLKLLENEENMFDAGLYCGLGGTVGSLVFLALGIIKASLMAAYASTLFGIVFVGIFKICHLRPYRRKLILETEMQNP